MDDAGVMGFSAAVIVDKRMVWMKGYGFMDWQRTRPFTPNTTAKVASVAKPFVGVKSVPSTLAVSDPEINGSASSPPPPPHAITKRSTGTNRMPSL